VSETETPLGNAPDDQAWEDEGPVAADAVRTLFVTLGKTFRAYQLYEENNPVRRRFVDQLRTEFQSLWEDLDKLVVTIDEDHMYLQGTEVYRSESRNDSLAFLFFKDGVREITFRPGLEAEELELFLGVLQRARKLVPEGDDLLTVLWEQNLSFFDYQYVDLLAEGVVLPEAGAGNTQSEMKAPSRRMPYVRSSSRSGRRSGRISCTTRTTPCGGASSTSSGPSSSRSGRTSTSSS